MRANSGLREPAVPIALGCALYLGAGFVVLLALRDPGGRWNVTIPEHPGPQAVAVLPTVPRPE